MLANKHTRNVCLLSAPSNHTSRGVLAQDTLARTPLWLTMMKPYPSVNGHWDPKQANGNNSARLALSPQVLIFPPPLLGHHLMVTSFLDLSKVIIQLMKDGNGKRTFELGPIITMSFHQWDSKAKNKTPQIPPNKTLPFLVCLARKPCANPLKAQVAPNGQRNYSVNPPKPKSHLFLARVHPSNHLRTIQLVSQNLRWLLCNPGRNLLASHHFSFFTPINFFSPFLRPSLACPTTPRSIIIIENTPVGSSTPTLVPSPEIPPSSPKKPNASSPPVQSPSHSNDEACQEFSDLQPTLMIPQTIIHKSCWSIAAFST
ncbi:hypothetical protein O181_088013 [Austropuccinia psidii MF-1]|uniref:Uncharacterized protein n=1 Tax=Austropuccinia psidii MF-1 TaxID=1389203 RepID=A0A9Q3P238_9BASI|nr:hypothetical protein [Austropuccinia psidii MF-1]